MFCKSDLYETGNEVVSAATASTPVVTNRRGSVRGRGSSQRGRGRGGSRGITIIA